MRKYAKTVVLLTAGLFIAVEALCTQTIDTTAMVVCGKSEQPTPCVLILNRSVPSYELTIRNENVNIVTIKVERTKDAWQVLGQSRKERLIEVVIDIKDASCVVFNPRFPNIAKDLIPEGCDGLMIRTVEVKA